MEEDKKSLSYFAMLGFIMPVLGLIGATVGLVADSTAYMISGGVSILFGIAMGVLSLRE